MLKRLYYNWMIIKKIIATTSSQKGFVWTKMYTFTPATECHSSALETRSVPVMGILGPLRTWNRKRQTLSMDYIYDCGMILVYHVSYLVSMPSLVEIY